MMVSSHPAQAAAKPRLSDGAGLLDDFQSRLGAMNAKLLEERTVFKVGPPISVERIRLAPDFWMPADFGVGSFIQLPPHDFSVGRPVSGVGGELVSAEKGSVLNIDTGSGR